MESALALLIALINNAQQVSQLIATARAEGRDVSDAEIDALFAENDAALNEARAKINAARANPT